MTHKIAAIRTGNNLNVIATFYDGTIKEYDVKKMFAIYPKMQELQGDSTLFNSVQIDTGGYGISWSDELDLDSDTIWKEGKTIGNEDTDLLLRLAALVSDSRNHAGITQKELSERTGIYQSDISKIERGLANPSVTTLQRIADGMGMKLVIGFE